MFKGAKAFGSFSVDDIAKARQFYEGTLGIEVTTPMEGMLELQHAGGATTSIYPKHDHQPATFTVLNFVVDDIESAVDELGAKGITFEQYDNEYITTDAKGIARDDQGPAIAWFKDPAGNVVSVLQL